MITPNPNNKLFTADIFPDDNEIGNAMWGYHIANNFSRLFMVQYRHHVFMEDWRTISQNRGWEYENFYGRLGDSNCLYSAEFKIDISKYNFHVPPVAQFWVSVIERNSQYPHQLYPELNPSWVDGELAGDYLTVRLRLNSLSGLYCTATVVTRLYGA